MDKTYAESRGVSPFDWNLALANPPAFESLQHQHLIDLSSQWVTCACGNQCAILARDPSGRPQAHYLSSRGGDFYKYIVHGEWELAREALQRIEARATLLVEQELSRRTRELQQDPELSEP